MSPCALYLGCLYHKVTYALGRQGKVLPTTIYTYSVVDNQKAIV